MNAILAILLLGLCIVTLVFSLVAICWVASGESDVNGDPERDSGASGDEIAALSRSWDHGSRETESRPNLDYARRLNREAMRTTLHR